MNAYNDPRITIHYFFLCYRTPVIITEQSNFVNIMEQFQFNHKILKTWKIDYYPQNLYLKHWQQNVVQTNACTT